MKNRLTLLTFLSLASIASATTVNTVTVPENGLTFVMLSVGLAGLGFLRRRLAK
ncbi:MAG: hypothetical protein JWM88_789 [Verrucomicrobia bacterium]|nr:hypothetical protein [Verrucomicrobiota bacterium]